MLSDEDDEYSAAPLNSDAPLNSGVAALGLKNLLY